MRQVYLEEIVNKAASAADDYVYTPRVKKGKILVVRNLSCTWAAIATTEEAHFFVEDMGRKIFLGEDVPLDTGGHPCWTGKVAIGENDRAGVYCPDIAQNDIVKFFVCGELWDSKDWINLK